MSKTAKQPKIQPKVHFATPQSDGTIVLDKPQGITYPENSKRKRGKVDRQLFMELIGKGFTQDEAYIKAGGIATTNSTARSEAVKLKQVIFASDPSTKITFLDRLQQTRNELLENITPFDMQTASLKDKAISLGIMIEKVQLLSGQPTENVANLHLHVKANYMQLEDDDLETRLLEI